jgi:hypothetical protein
MFIVVAPVTLIRTENSARIKLGNPCGVSRRVAVWVPGDIGIGWIVKMSDPSLGMELNDEDERVKAEDEPLTNESSNGEVSFSAKFLMVTFSGG